MKSKSSISTLRIWDSQDPYSSDPYVYDAHIHHLIFGGVFSKLFSTYADAKTTSYAVKVWRSEKSFTNWEFDIREDLSFSNGDPLTAEDVASSLKRIIFLARKNNSSLPLAKDILGVENFKQLSDDLRGVSVRGNTLYIKLKKGDPDLRENLSFGNYAIVHKNDFDAETGKWKSRIPISSGPYELNEFDLERKIAKLSLRKIFPEELRHAKAFSEIEISWNVADRYRADILDGFSGESAPSRGHSLHRNKGTDLIYLQLYSWVNPKNVLADSVVRKSFRENFYAKSESIGLGVVRSFFPLILPGVSEVPAIAYSPGTKYFAGKTLRVRPPKNLQVPQLKKLKQALILTVEDAGGKIELIDDVTSEQLVKYGDKKFGDVVDLDIAVRGTSMGAEDPILTVKQMFSKEGINIPDPTGKAHEIIYGDFSLTKLNEIIFDDATVIPVYHYSNGFWANDRIDFSRFNTMLAVSELQWLGQK